MEATAAIHAPPTHPQQRIPSAAPALAHGLNALLALAAFVLLMRSLAGRFSAPLLPALSLAAIVLMAALAAAVRRCAACPRPSHRRTPHFALHYGPALALATAILALAVAGAPPTTLTAAALIVLFEESYGAWSRRRIRPHSNRAKLRGPIPDKLPLETTAAAHHRQTPPPDPLPLPHHAPSAALDLLPNDAPDVLQHVLRIENPDGTQRCQGWCRTRFLPSARHAVEHLSFCPPFLHSPRVDCRHLSGPPVRLRVSRVLPHGASVELRLNNPSTEPISVTFAFTASVGPN